MSRGIGALARLVLQDDETVIYEYGGYNLNDEAFRNEQRILDGTITIKKSCFPEPEIHEQLKKMPSGRKKLITKRIPVIVDYDRLFRDRSIEVEDCSNCWMKTDDELQIDIMACHIIYKLFRQYQEQGVIPECVGYYV
jgi:hypothetical protein